MKKFLATLSFVLLPSLLVFASSFSDISGHDNEEAIDYLYEENVIEGYNDGTYQPDSYINRAEFVKILMETLYSNQESGSSCFLDVKDDWYAEYVCEAKDLDIVDGYDDGTFRPGNYINLAESLKIILETYEIDVCESCYSLWYEPYYEEAQDLDLLDEVSQNVSHQITRGEMAQLIYNVEIYLTPQEPTETPQEPTEKKVCYLSDDERDYFYDYEDEIDLDEFSVNYEYEVDSESECADYSEYHYEGDVGYVPNLAIIEIEADDPGRYSDGSVRTEVFLEKFYESYEDEFDMVAHVSLDYDNDNGFYNGISGGYIHRYLPTNIGQVELECLTSKGEPCEYPDRLRRAGNVAGIDNLSDYIFTHEIGHYWNAGWYQEEEDNSCYESWTYTGLHNNHWTQYSVVGETTSPVSYWSSWSESDDPAPYGSVTDNGDGTFTYDSYMAGDERILKFNYMDLYAMGLMTEAELASKEMYFILDPVYIGKDGDKYIYTGTRYDLELEDFKDLLKRRESCDATDSNSFYTGDGSRVLHEYDEGEEFAENFKVAVALLKSPDQELTTYDAFQLCEAVNYKWPAAWYEATDERSIVNLSLEGYVDKETCEEMFGFNL